MIVATVLKSGGIYSPEWVHKLERSVSDHLTLSHEFVCLTDMDVDCKRIPLRDDLPGWWSKIELFRPGLFDDRVVYFDLDTLVLGDLTELAAYSGPFAGLRDFIYPARMQSAVMAWEPTTETDLVYERFRPSVMEDRAMWSDQPWIDACLPDTDRLQDHARGIYSLRLQALQARPTDAVLVCGHGTPRFNDRGAGWAHTVWSDL
ncbi:MAG: hypothetical protein VW362_07745 [Candidatus Nanopelagicales bacterium]